LATTTVRSLPPLLAPLPQFFLGGDFETADSYHGWFFQFAFAATAATIVNGAVAERCQMTAYAAYSLFLTAWVYPVVVHAIWSGNGYLCAWRVDGAINGGWSARPSQRARAARAPPSAQRVPSPRAGSSPTAPSLAREPAPHACTHLANARMHSPPRPLTRTHAGVGVIDFAGCGVVHMTGGISAMIGAAVLGPRAGRFDPLTGKVDDPMPGHNAALVVLGTFLLWFGWYGFNPGSTLMIHGAEFVAAKCAATTTLAAAAGCIANLAIHKWLSGILSLEEACNGALAGAWWGVVVRPPRFRGPSASRPAHPSPPFSVHALTPHSPVLPFRHPHGSTQFSGLVGITSACSVVDCWAAIACGAIGAVAYTFGAKLCLKLRIDDPVNATAVHFFAGMWGLMAPAFFAKESNMINSYGISGHEGLFYGGGGMLGTQVGGAGRGNATRELCALVAHACARRGASPYRPAALRLWLTHHSPSTHHPPRTVHQALGLVVVVGWVTLNMLPFFVMLKMMGVFRVDSDTEEAGMDASEHGGGAYNLGKK